MAKSDLLKVGLQFNHILKKKVGSRENTLFWLDEWTDEGTLKVQFPELYKIECKKNYFISDRITNVGVHWDWSVDVNLVGLFNELSSLVSRINSFTPNMCRDTWYFILSSDGNFI